jgi:uncharacterized protein YbjQ (UPF0145 family)
MQPNQPPPAMLVSSTSTIEGATEVQYLGVVEGIAIMGANMFKDIFAGFRDIVGGRSATYEKELEKARTVAIQDMMAKAAYLGANGVIGVDLDFETVGSSDSMLMVAATGTAVRFR